MFHDFCQSVTLAFGQRTHVSHDHHPRGPCCSRARISYDEPCMGVISYQKTFASALMTEREGRHGNGRFTEVTMVRSLNDVRLRSGDDALPVHWFEITVVHAKTGEQLSHHSCITNHRLNNDNVVAVAQARRGRWKIANDNNNVLKTKGYHLEHNFGHGKQYLSACMLSLNLRAFLFHTVLEWSDAKYALLRKVLARRQTFFHDIQALMRYMVFDNWGHLMDFMIRGLELESQVDTS